MGKHLAHAPTSTARFNAILSFLIHSSLSSANEFNHIWRRQWRLPIFRSLIIIVTFILVISIGLNMADQFAQTVINVWLENDFYYLKLPQRTRQLATISADGTKLVFAAERDNLVPGDTNGVMDIFLCYQRLK